MFIFIETVAHATVLLPQSNKPKIPTEETSAPGLGSHILPI